MNPVPVDEKFIRKAYHVLHPYANQTEIRGMPIQALLNTIVRELQTLCRKNMTHLITTFVIALGIDEEVSPNEDATVLCPRLIKMFQSYRSGLSRPYSPIRSPMLNRTSSY